MALELLRKGSTCKLVGTYIENGEIMITVLHDQNGFVYFSLGDTDRQTKEIQEYISELIPEISAGVYQVEFFDIKEEIF
ncbi:hypothetical protein [Aquibacillus saliphilus]|uniref:hypothetical protein n=1 Tax=Aquibacillus saliphilus TaxID=1909422 RepID=UPI001CF03A06|nr:hypothetical protein [Aquibacillus saliphilus]